jgi:hypothetical protein
VPIPIGSDPMVRRRMIVVARWSLVADGGREKRLDVDDGAIWTLVLPPYGWRSSP